MDNFFRRVQLKVTVDLWDWDREKLTSTEDITNWITSYRFQKTIKTVTGSCQIEMKPQTNLYHILDRFNTMDVVKIYEFGVLKFIGYIHRISYSGTISEDGRPMRSGILTVVQFGGILSYAQTGIGIGTYYNKPELIEYAITMQKKIADSVKDGITSFKSIITTLFGSLREYVENLGGSAFLAYMDNYLSIGPGLSSTNTEEAPKTFNLFTGTEQSLSAWEIIEQMVERPLNEVFIDNGPRRISLGGTQTSLSSDLEYMIFRETPFDGRVGGSSATAFSDMPSLKIDKSSYVRFDFSRSMDEVYSTYVVKLPEHDFSDLTRQLLGGYVVDETMLKKYLFQPMMAEKFFITRKTSDMSGAKPRSTYEAAGGNYAETLKNWFRLNDKYLSGVLTMKVPSDGTKDPRIGDKLEIEGLEGSFYVESIAHTWSYMKALISNVTITRGYGLNGQMEMSDRIFKRNPVK